jgi:hypothetical protein
VLGTVAAAEISELYCLGSRTQYTLPGRGLMFYFGGLIALNLGQEFFLKKLTPPAQRVNGGAGGNVNVPLRSNQARGAATPVQYQELPGSGKVEVTLIRRGRRGLPGDGVKQISTSYSTAANDRNSFA